MSTGGGFATRSLYENDEETIFDSQRPAILTGIEELANRSDLLDRSLMLQLPRIPDDRRRTEAEHWREFREAHARALGAVLDAVATAVRNIPTTHISGLPRMADFALWATAAEPGFGLLSGAFLDAYQGNRDAANDTALEASPVAKYIVQMAEASEWQGPSAELLEHLETMATEGEKRLREWPKNPRCLSGSIKRLAPNLRTAGVEVEFGHAGRGREKRRSVVIRRTTDSCDPSVPSTPDPENTLPFEDSGVACGPNGDTNHPGGDSAGTQTQVEENTGKTEVGTRGDDGDAKPLSCSDWESFTI